MAQGSPARPRGASLIRAIATLLVAASLLAACGGDEDPRRVTTERTLAAVCALDATTGVDGVAGVFRDRAHQGLHDIAGWLVDTDAATAGDLLLAKEAIERDLEGAPTQDALATHVAALQRATIAAIEALGYPAGPCAP